MIGPGVCRLVNVGVFQPGGLCMGFLYVCVPRMENQQKKACVIQEWSPERSLVADLCSGFYYRKIISGRIDSIHPGIDKVYDNRLSSGMFHWYLDSSPGISCIFFVCLCMVGHNTLPTTGYQPDVSLSLCNDWPHPSLVGIVTPGKFQVLGILYGWGSNPHTLRMLRYYAPGTQMI